eukprot:Colp12_sorted_trinity150504_noHs@22243
MRFLRLDALRRAVGSSLSVVQSSCQRAVASTNLTFNKKNAIRQRQIICRALATETGAKVDLAHTHPARTHTCGELRSTHIDQKVSLCGWLEQKRHIGESLVFAPLRDAYGTTQIVISAVSTV